ncbi:MAG: hypothetical protein DRI26_08140, partial [Chloroflexi bacterium]
MNPFWGISFITSLIYCTLLALNLLHRPRERVHKSFTLFLLAALLWNLTTFFIRDNFSPGQTFLFAQITLIMAALTAALYYHFIHVFLNKAGGIELRCVYGLVAIFSFLVIQGQFIRSSQIVGGALSIEYEPTVYPLVLLLAGFTLRGIYLLIRQRNLSLDPIHRDRILYIIIGFACAAISYLLEVLPSLSRYPLVTFGSLGNALFIAHAILKYQLLDIRVVVRRGLVYTSLGIGLVGLYLGTLLGLLQFAHLQTTALTLLASALVALTVAALFYPLRKPIQERVEQL